MHLVEFCYRSTITDQMFCHAINDHRSLRSLINRPSLVLILLDGRSIFDHPIINHRSPITDHRSSYAFNVPGCRTIIDHPITDHRSPITDHRPFLRIWCSRFCRTITDHRSPITDQSIVSTHVVYHVVVQSDHRLLIKNRSTGSKQLNWSPIIDHRQNISLRILCTRLPWNHRSPIIDQKPITDHRSPIKHQSTHFMY